jgi:hypothetical protein
MVSMRAMWGMRAVSPLVLPGKNSVHRRLYPRTLVHLTFSHVFLFGLCLVARSNDELLVGSNKEGLDLVKEAIEKAGYTGKVKIGMDVAASEFFTRKCALTFCFAIHAKAMLCYLIRL